MTTVEVCGTCNKEVCKHDMLSSGDSDLCDACYCDELEAYDEAYGDE